MNFKRCVAGDQVRNLKKELNLSTRWLPWMEGKGLLVQLTQKAARYKYFVGFVMANKLEIKIL